jgi:uncharacterized protein
VKRPWGRALALGAFALTAGWFAAQALWFEPASLRVAEHALALPRWPAACDGLRVAVLADLHIGSAWNGIERVPQLVAATNTARPDLVLLAGDYVVAHGMAFGERIAPPEVARELSALRAPLGVFAALGNHDGWWGAREVRDALTSAGITVLEDAARPLARGACKFTVVGISDLWTGPHRVGHAFAGVPEDAATLALMHNPDLFPLLPRWSALGIAGHTHGGQVALPGFGRPVIPSKFGERFAAGHIVEGEKHYFVTTGIGTSVYPVRFRVPPEIVVLTLSSERVR